MVIFSILIGIVGLSLLVLVHEYGHFLAARAVGVEVEAFAIGMGKPLLSVKGKSTEFRICALPLGGYCKMKGENFLLNAIDNPKGQDIEPSPDSFYGVSPWKRIIIAVAGPLFNLILAIILLSLLSLIGKTYQSSSNQIVLSYEIDGKSLPADQAGLKTGDRILSIDGILTPSFQSVQEALTSQQKPTRSLSVQSRDGSLRELGIEPLVVSGRPRIGIYPWVEPVLSAIPEKSIFVPLNLKKGDRILSVNGQKITHALEFQKMVELKPETVEIVYQREGKEFTEAVSPLYSDKSQFLDFELSTFQETGLPFWEALPQGFFLAFEFSGQMLSQMGSLVFSGELWGQVSGPLGITYQVGQATILSFLQDGQLGFSSILMFLSFISLALMVMNLLPIPILDGGQVFINLLAIVRRKPFRGITLVRYQQFGTFLVLGIFILATMNDITSFFK